MVIKIVKILLKIFYIFPINNKKIFITSFGGSSSFAFDGKALVNYSNDNNLKYKFIWGINKNSNKIKNQTNVKFVKIKSLIGFYHLLTCRIFITNINPPIYIPFRKKQIRINTWHGYPVKSIGKYYGNNIDNLNLNTCFISHSKHYTDYVIKDAFEFKGDILKCGAPRNDIFFSKQCSFVKEIVTDKYHIKNKKIILYAPTFRGDFENPNDNFNYDELLKVVEKKYGGDWIILKRLHPMISKKNIEHNSEKIIDVSDYEDTQDLLCSSDILITDYSSIPWDFSLMKKPVFLYAYDYDEYKKNRDFNPLVGNRPFPMGKNMDELFECIRNFDNQRYIKELEKYWKNEDNYEHGNACKTIYEYIDDNIR